MFRRSLPGEIASDPALEGTSAGTFWADNMGHFVLWKDRVGVDSANRYDPGVCVLGGAMKVMPLDREARRRVVSTWPWLTARNGPMRLWWLPNLVAGAAIAAVASWGRPEVAVLCAVIYWIPTTTVVFFRSYRRWLTEPETPSRSEVRRMTEGPFPSELDR